MSYQKLILIGNLGKDPVKRMAGETPVTSFTLATSNQYTNRDGEKVNDTTWFNVSVWGKPAESAAKYLKKGSKVMVEGVLTPDKATGRPRVYESNGTTGASYEVKAQVVKFLSPKSEGSSRDEEDEVEATDESEW